MEAYDRIVCVVGPTASGKTKMAVELAKQLGGEVISCDSMQIYRGMDVGTAKPTDEEMQGIPHHMIDIAEPDEDFSVGRYVEVADACVQDVLSRGKTAVIAGGTGLYVDSLIAGRSFAPVPSTGKREMLERRAETEGIGALHRELSEVDPETAARLPLADRRRIIRALEAAARLHPADEKRIVRALEVYEETGKTITQHNLETQAIPPRYRPVWLGMTFEDRAALYARIDLRVEEMMRQGLADEVRALLRRGGMVKQASDVLSVGDIALSPSHREITVAGAPLKLTLREFDLLEYLMRKPGVVFTRESLLQSVWGWHFDGGSRTVDVHVQTLRQKLGEHAGAIETVRGVGYRLAEPSADDGPEGADAEVSTAGKLEE